MTWSFLELPPIAELVHNTLISLRPEAESKVKAIGDEFVYFCPFHDDRKTPNLFVNYRKGVFICFACHASGTVEYLLKYLTGAEVGDMKGTSSLMSFWKEETKPADEEDYVILQTKRKISRETLERCDMRKVRNDGGDLNSQFFGYILFPIYDQSRRFMLSFVGYNPVSGNKPKYSFPSGFRLFPFGFHLLNGSGGGLLFVLEGMWDALSLIDEGHNALAILGAHNYRLLQKIPPTNKYKVILAPDFDSAGRSAAPSWALHAILGEHYDAEVWLSDVKTMGNNKDFNDIKRAGGCVTKYFDRMEKRSALEFLLATAKEEDKAGRLLSILSMVLPPTLYLEAVTAVYCSDELVNKFPPADLSQLIPPYIPSAHLLRAMGSDWVLFTYALRSPQYRHLVLEYFLPNEVYPLLHVFPQREELVGLPVGLKESDLRAAVYHVVKVLRGARPSTLKELADLCELIPKGGV